MPKFLGLVFIIGFGTNLLWENAQASFYVGYTNFWQHFTMCFLAAIIDGIIITLLAMAFWLLRKRTRRTNRPNISELSMLALIGAIIAIGIEKWALIYAYWQYMPAMLLLPVLSVGLLPLLQLMVLVPLTIFFAHKIINYSTKGVTYR